MAGDWRDVFFERDKRVFKEEAEACSSSSAARRTTTGSSRPVQAGGRSRPQIYGGTDSVDRFPIVGPDTADVLVNLEESVW
jgi:hypothetical protein